MIKTHTFLVWLTLLLITISFPAYADLGSVARNIMEPVGVFGGFVNTGCFVIGGGFIFASIVKYAEHKRSPLMVPISTVIFLLIAGLILVALPFLALLTETGVKYNI